MLRTICAGPSGQRPERHNAVTGRLFRLVPPPEARFTAIEQDFAQ
jgi:hypothetical protein